MRHLGTLLMAWCLVAASCGWAAAPAMATTPATTPAAAPKIVRIDPPEQGFYAKLLDYHGIPIKAPAVVVDEALYEAWQRLDIQLGKLPAVRDNLALAGAELHIIGRDQVTSDLPEHRHLKGKPFDGKLTVDERTRGLGGLLTSCGEENLLRLEQDRYRGRDICTHEFAHNIYNQGVPAAFREKWTAQYRQSLAKDRWQKSYAGSNDNEFFAELSMWYFGTHGDLGMTGPKPEPGREALRKYDPEAFALMDDFYSGRIAIARVEYVELPLLPAARAADVRSGESKQSTTVQLRNGTDAELQLYWVDSTGQRKRYGSAPPHGRWTQNTFAGHAWVVTDTAGVAKGAFVADAKPGVVTIER